MADVFKKVYTEVQPQYKAKILAAKEKAEELLAFMDVNNREMSVAKTNLEQAMMWCTKGFVVQSDLESQEK